MVKKSFFILILLVGILAISCNKDKVSPIITLNGASTVYVEKNSVYTDAGAIATDDVDGDITTEIKIKNPVNTAEVGIYYVTFNVSDKAGNDAEEVRRRVDVKIF